MGCNVYGSVASTVGSRRDGEPNYRIVSQAATAPVLEDDGILEWLGSPILRRM